MALKKRLDLFYGGEIGVVTTLLAAVAFARAGAVIARRDHLPGVGIVGSEALHGPFEGFFLGETALGEKVAHTHDILVMAAALEHDAFFRQLGGYEGVEIGLYPACLLVLLALLGIGGHGGGYLFCRESHGLALGTEKHVGVVGKTAQTGDVLALYVGLGVEELLIMGVATVERRLIVGDDLVKVVCVNQEFVGLRQLILEDHTESVAADCCVAHQRVGIGDDLLLHLGEGLCRFGRRGSGGGHDMVEIDKREACQSADLFLALAALKEACHSKERTLALEGLAACLTIRLCEGGHLLIAADKVGHSFEETWQGGLAGHVLKNANFH